MDSENKKMMSVILSEEAIAQLNSAVQQLNTNHSDLIDWLCRNYRLINELLDVVEDILLYSSSTEECLPPHPSYEVDGEQIRRLPQLLESLINGEGFPF